MQIPAPPGWRLLVLREPTRPDSPRRSCPAAPARGLPPRSAGPCSRCRRRQRGEPACNGSHAHPLETRRRGGQLLCQWANGPRRWTPPHPGDAARTARQPSRIGPQPAGSPPSAGAGRRRGHCRTPRRPTRRRLVPGRSTLQAVSEHGQSWTTIGPPRDVGRGAARWNAARSPGGRHHWSVSDRCLDAALHPRRPACGGTRGRPPGRQPAPPGCRSGRWPCGNPS